MYGDFIAVDDITFDVKKGEIVGFLGPNGAGKSTTMKIITCYMAPNRGNVSIHGHDIFDDFVEVRKKIGYLPENTPLYEEMNVLECLEFFARVRDIPREKQAKSIAHMIEVCGLKEKVKSEVAELSKGYRQRVGLAQAMIHNPDILVLDEPTSGLDPNQIVEIRSLIRELGKEKTVILSTHILSEVEATCDRVIIINKGKIVGQDTPAALRQKSSQTNVIMVEVEGALAAITACLEGIEGIQTVEKIDHPERGVFRIKVGVSAEKDLRKTISRKLMNEGFELLGMQMHTVSLEDVFRELTV